MAEHGRLNAAVTIDPSQQWSHRPGTVVVMQKQTALGTIAGRCRRPSGDEAEDAAIEDEEAGDFTAAVTPCIRLPPLEPWEFTSGTTARVRVAQQRARLVVG
jgi:hypothetical protein